MTSINRQILLATRPVGMIRDECFRSMDAQMPEIGDGEALVRNIYLSIDPTIRGWLDDAESYLPPIQLGEVVRCGGIGEVVESNSSSYQVGDIVFGMLGWQEYSVAGSDGQQMNVLPKGLPLTALLSVFGITGMTAYFGMLEIGKPAEGETVVVSGAAGATGSVAGQIAKINGCRVVGIAGSDAKCAWVRDELGFDDCINYKTEKIPERLKEACPQGVDVFFDNVGGEILENVLDQINQRARVVLCGAISQYNATEKVPGPSNYMQLVIQRARMEGFIIMDYIPRFGEGMMKMGSWVAEGKVKYAVDVVDGLKNAPSAINRLFTGANNGKLLVKVSDEPS